MKKPKLISLWINPNNSSTLNTCEIDFNGIIMKIELNQEERNKITDLIYLHLGDVIMKLLKSCWMKHGKIMEIIIALLSRR